MQECDFFLYDIWGNFNDLPASSPANGVSVAMANLASQLAVTDVIYQENARNFKIINITTEGCDFYRPF